MTVEDKLTAARKILMQIDMPRGQLNDRSAWTLLALGNVTPDRRWADAEAPIVGITPVIDWIALNYGHRYTNGRLRNLALETGQAAFHPNQTLWPTARSCARRLSPPHVIGQNCCAR